MACAQKKIIRYQSIYMMDISYVYVDISSTFNEVQTKDLKQKRRDLF